MIDNIIFTYIIISQSSFNDNNNVTVTLISNLKSKTFPTEVEHRFTLRLTLLNQNN